MKKTFLFICSCLIPCLNYAQFGNMKFIYRNSGLLNDIVKNRTYHKDFFVDSTTYKNGINYTVSYIDTFRFVNSKIEICKGGKWHTFLSLNSKEKKFRYPFDREFNTAIYAENIIKSIMEYNGRTLIKFEKKLRV